ncbi:hypothetical protein DDZ13_15025 [Coraliomargarita sinensis]|uniref:DUF4760 domain-containing protein n=1 Tax=Coraliomargarita sinensis TaxID=2174842 RepID=A0A317ZHK7_9BACT|nr:hypothetical protein [Coraliomargarita sinensis]PXA02851.1 hypothetical protein DDZ13_15025 [Coraliomargarita sinensis]
MVDIIAQVSDPDPNYLKDVILPVVMFVAGFFVSRLTMSKKDRKDHERQMQKQVDTYQISLNREFNKFTDALREYRDLEGEPSLQDFLNISQAGEAYFTQLKMIADAAFAGTIPSPTRNSTFTQPIKETYEVSIPKFYETLDEIAKRRETSWNGEFRRGNYESISSYYEKYCIE